MTRKRVTFPKIIASLLLLVVSGIVSLAVPALAQNANPVTADGIPDKAHPAHIVQIKRRVRSHNVWCVLRSRPPRPHPTVLLLHGFPGYEQNMDLAQAIRRAGWNVFTFHYRGAWGSHGDFSFTHASEDCAAMLAYLRVPANATRLGVDPCAHRRHRPQHGWLHGRNHRRARRKLAGLVTISAWNIGSRSRGTPPQQEQAVIDRYRKKAALSPDAPPKPFGPKPGATPHSGTT